MFESSGIAAAQVRSWAEELRTAGKDLDDAARIDLIRALEELQCTTAAVQADVSVDFDASQRAAQAREGVPAARQGRGVAAQIAFARRQSPHRAQRELGLAKILRSELPHTRAAFRDGRITSWKTTIIARETACLSAEDRRTVDQVLAENAERLETMSEREIAAEAARLAYRLDPASIVARRRRAESDRRVTLRPAPDVMSQLSALLPVKDGVAVHASLTREADRLRAEGDPRTKGQIMADTLVDRVVAEADSGSTAQAGVMLDVVVTDATLFGTSDEPGHLDGYGPIPADLVRELAASVRVWVRRLYASPATGSLLAMDSRARLVPEGLKRFLRLRDRFCRTPWCDAPIRHADHVLPADDDGETSAVNTQGLCEACNHAKQAPGWQARPRPGPRHTVVVTTPTGHTYHSTAPPIMPPTYVEVAPGRWTLVA